MFCLRRHIQILTLVYSVLDIGRNTRSLTVFLLVNFGGIFFQNPLPAIPNKKFFCLLSRGGGELKDSVTVH